MSDCPAHRRSPARLGRRQFLTGAAASGVALGLAGTAADLAAGRATPASAATAFGYTSSGGYYTVSTGAGLTFKISQSDGDMVSLNYNGTELQDQSSFSQVESGLGAGATVTAAQSGNYIVITESVTDWYGSGTLIHYLVAVNGQNNIYLATYVNSAGAGELRWISRLNASVISTVYTPAEINGGTAIESTDIYSLDGQTRSKYYSNRQAMSLTVRGITGSGIGVYMAYGNRESSAGGPFFRDIEQQGTTDNQLYNYLWSAHNQTEAQRLSVLYGPYALMVGGTTAPAAPDMTFLASLGLTGLVPAASRGWVAGAASGVTAGAAVTVGWANSAAQYWATPQANGDFASPLMKPGSYTQTLYQGELAVATRTVTVTAGSRDDRAEHRLGLGHPGLAGVPDRHLGRHPERVPELGQPDLDAPVRCPDGELGAGHLHGRQQLGRGLPGLPVQGRQQPDHGARSRCRPARSRRAPCGSGSPPRTPAAGRRSR